MGVRAKILGFVLVCVAVLVASPARAELPRETDFLRRVNAAIEAGTQWLQTEAGKGGGGMDLGYPGGPHALQYYTLRVCGVPRGDPAAVRVWDKLRATYDSIGRRGLTTYTAALMALAIQAHATHDMADLVGRPAGDEERITPLGDDERKWMEELVKYLEREQKQGVWDYGTPQRSAYDHSNTQYALLGLKAAAQCGVDVKTSTWRKALDHFLRAQQRKGPRLARGGAASDPGQTQAKEFDEARGWSYRDEDAAYGSMTAGGVGCVVICRSELIGKHGYPDRVDAQAEQSIRDGIAWLGHHFSVKTNPVQSSSGGLWYFYYMYALERAGVLAGVDWMGTRDWYGEGAEELLSRQTRGGTWDVAGAQTFSGRPTLDTCFALLFLKKGTLGVRRGSLTQALDETSVNFDVAGGLAPKDFDDFIDTVLSVWRRVDGTRDAVGVRRRLGEKLASVGPRVVGPLVQRLDSPDDGKRAAACGLLRAATGEEFGFDPAAPREEREAGLERWQEWYLMSAKGLAYDPETKRLVGGR